MLKITKVGLLKEFCTVAAFPIEICDAQQEKKKKEKKNGFKNLNELKSRKKRKGKIISDYLIQFDLQFL